MTEIINNEDAEKITICEGIENQKSSVEFLDIKIERNEHGDGYVIRSYADHKDGDYVHTFDLDLAPVQLEQLAKALNNFIASDKLGINRYKYVKREDPKPTDQYFNVAYGAMVKINLERERASLPKEEYVADRS